MYKHSKRKKPLIIAGVILAVIALIAAVIVFLYFNSTYHLKQKLVTQIWYEDVLLAMNEYKTAGESNVLYFDEDGTGISESYERYREVGSDGKPSVSNPQYRSRSSFSWAILADKSLFFRGEYYTYKKDWYFVGKDEVYIGGITYSSKNLCGYEKD